MEFEDLNIKTLDYIVRFRDHPETIEKLKSDEFLFHHFPECELTEDSNPDLTVNRDYQGDENLRLREDGFDYKEAHHRDIVSVAEYILEIRRQVDHGWYKIASSTASDGENAVTFFGGATNLGKTTSALEVSKYHGFNLYSDEKTIFDLYNQNVISGCKSIHTHKDIIKQRVGAETDSDFYNNEHKDNGLRKSKLLIYPHIDHGLEEPIFYKFKSLDLFWLFSKEINGISKAVNKYFNNFKENVPSLDYHSLAQKRTDDAWKFAEKTPCYYFQGSKEQIAGFVKEYLSKH